MATHSSILVWRIPGMEEPGGLLSTGSHRTRHDRSDLAAAYNWGESDRRCLKGWDSFLVRHSFFCLFVCRVLFAKFPCKFVKTPKILKIKKKTWWFKNPSIPLISQLCWWFCAGVWMIRSILVSLDASYCLGSWVTSLEVNLDSSISLFLLYPPPVTLKAHQVSLLSILLLSPLLRS